ncbi:MAG: aminotransferase class I/II-fold pyridoxal phosphate-dependent enzyme [Verrucomicrobiota bacterium]|nr:aminotransferase class I/II-fold pyridoxal phosphate-dependent enzyme [Verrucomicrobiota bacterium]MDQ6940517.1 aminotransferase class I/II-fold pyridoxal phosphate-dependent enzyme [Verrucomicrobiota bacterium]
MNNSDLSDIPAETFRKHLHEVADWIADYRENIAQTRISPNEKPGAIRNALPKSAPEEPESLEAIMADFQRVIFPGITQWNHPQFMGYFGVTTTGPGILAEMLTAALNVNTMTWRVSPAATELETVVLGWLQQWLSLPNEFNGVVYDTASIATMHALAAAREEAGTSVRTLGLSGRDELPIFRVYASDQAHSSVDKACIALGLGEHNVRRIASDAEFKMDVKALRDAVAADLRKEFQPLAVVATVGTTSTASVDPVKEIARVCREHNMWLHVDAAYGGGIALLPECDWVKEGWNESDSLVMNPHKMLFVPFDFSALYVRDIKRLRDVFTLVPEYLRGDAAGAEINYMDYGVQLGRRFRALKAWMVWRAFGREGIAARIREHLRLAQLFTKWVKEDPRFEISAPTVMGVVCFRIKAAEDATADKLNSKLVETINAGGETYLMQTKLRGRAVMRLGLGNILTTEEHLSRVWDIIKEAVATA